MFKQFSPLFYIFSISFLIIIQLLMIVFPAAELFLTVLNYSYRYILLLLLILVNALLIYSFYELIKTFKNFKNSAKTAYKDILKPAVILVISLGILIFEISFFKITLIKTGPTAPADFIYTSEPFIQVSQGTGNSIKSPSENMSIWWFTSEKKNFIFKYGKNEDESKMIQADIKSGDGRRFSVDLEKLEPSQKYYYKIDGLSRAIYSFKTAPAENSAEDVRILSVGDMRTGKNKVYSFYEEINSAADTIYSKTGLPSFKMNAGDIIHNGNDFYSWKFFLDIEKKHSPYLPNVITIGNHELYNDGGQNFDYIINLPRYYSFSWGMVHVINLNNYDGILNTLSMQQMVFLKNELIKHSGKKWIIVQFHTPVISTGDYNMNRLLIKQLFDLFRKYKVDLVVTGHDHHFESFLVDGDENWGGTFYIVNGGGGSKLDTTNMIRKNKQWKSWVHDRNSKNGLFQDDEITRKYHIYSESAWGFTDIKITSGEMIIDYYRWLDIEKYLALSKQNIKWWKMTSLSEETMKKEGLDKPELIKSFKKKRIFER